MLKIGKRLKVNGIIGSNCGLFLTFPPSELLTFFPLSSDFCRHSYYRPHRRTSQIVLVVVLVLVLDAVFSVILHELLLFEYEGEHEEEDETDVTQLSMNFRFSWIIMVSTIMPKPVAISTLSIDCDLPPRPTSPACEKQI